MACFFVGWTRLSNVEDRSINIFNAASQYLKGGL